MSWIKMRAFFNDGSVRGGQALRISLIDYFVLEALDKWEVFSQDAPIAQNVDRPDQRQMASFVIASATIALSGYPLELGLQFEDFSTSRLEFAKSLAIKETLDLHRKNGFIKPPSYDEPTERLTSDGRAFLRDLLPRVDEFDKLFQYLPSTYFLAFDLLSGQKPLTPPPIRYFLQDSLAGLVAKSSEQLRTELIELAAGLCAIGAERRGYLFDPRYKDIGTRFRDSASGFESSARNSSSMKHVT